MNRGAFAPIPGRARSPKRNAVFLLAALLAAGCKLGPDYQRPAVPMPPTWREASASESESYANMPWWEVFQDPQLQELIRIALAENKDLKIAVERIEAARALYGFTKADFWPQVDAEASAGRFKTSEEGLIKQESTDESLYVLRGTVSWEIDVFGRVRRATEAQLALLLAEEEARRAVVLTLVSDVARTYVELQDLDRRLEISVRTLESRREYVELARTRFEGGLTSELDFRQAESEMHRTEAIVHQFELSVVQKENELSVLLGRNPTAIPRGAAILDQSLPPAIPAGLPSELIDRRPDLLQAEQFLVAAGARIGEAKALLFPRISLTGDVGWVTTDVENIFSSPALSWSIAGNLLQPIFNAGKNRRRVEFTESEQRQTLYAYERSILQALREVEDSLVGYRKGGELRASQDERVKAEEKVLSLAELRYRGGVADYLEVLDAQRSLFSAELDEVEAIRDQLVSLIQLYKALGGGWPGSPEEAAEAAPAEQPTN